MSQAKKKRVIHQITKHHIIDEYWVQNMTLVINFFGHILEENFE